MLFTTIPQQYTENIESISNLLFQFITKFIIKKISLFTLIKYLLLFQDNMVLHFRLLIFLATGNHK